MPLPRKQEARDLTFPLFAGDGPANVETMVRINPLSTPDGLRDILALRGLRGSAESVDACQAWFGRRNQAVRRITTG